MKINKSIEVESVEEMDPLDKELLELIKNDRTLAVTLKPELLPKPVKFTKIPQKSIFVNDTAIRAVKTSFDRDRWQDILKKTGINDNVS